MPSVVGALRPRIAATSLRSVARARYLWLVAVTVVVVAAIALPAFRNPVSVGSLLATLSPILLIATGQAVVVLYGGIDLSVGATAGLATVLVALSPMLPGGTPVALALALAGGLVVGLLNAAGVVAGVNPLLMTFAMAGMVQGMALLVQGTSGAHVPAALFDVLGASLGPVPVLAPVALAALAGTWWWVGQSRTGRVVQAAGFDDRIATRLGFPVRRTTFVVYAVSGLLSAAGGLAIVVRTYTADALVGSSSVIDSIATVLVAGIVITGGIGSVLSVLPAAVIIAVVGQVITLTGTDSYYQTIFKGVLLVAAVGVYSLAGKRITVPWRLRLPAFRRPTGGGSAR